LSGTLVSLLVCNTLKPTIIIAARQSLILAEPLQVVVDANTKSFLGHGMPPVS
jgi:hypothetical protein